MGGVSFVAMRSVHRQGHWRVEMTWPQSPPRYFGKFDSAAEAERWIAEHRWLTKQNFERQVDRSEKNDKAAN